VPELAEVEFFRKQWDPSLGQKVVRVHLNEGKRVFRGVDLELLRRVAGQKLVSSEASGKQMLFRFGKDLWLGVHLGMTGKLSVAPKTLVPGKHDHLVLFQAKRALVFNDVRQFGRVQIHRGAEAPVWWSRIGPAVTSEGFTFEAMNAFLERRLRLPIKGALLVQKGFPGIGNWMADEILWRAGIRPARATSSLNQAERRKLYRETRLVARVALERIGADWGDPPKGWLFHERWGKGGVCPKHKSKLQRAIVATRTTAWCAECQK
jgi:formamidopyrimidine-DNA glycosylase